MPRLVVGVLALLCAAATPRAQDAPTDWWSLRPLHAPSVPVVDGVTNPIDAFVLDRLRREGLDASGPADRRTLFRRASFALHGLPPDPAASERFVADPRPAAFAELVETLLASPYYGERFGRFWLDVARYADTHGFDKDKLRQNAWPYRDWVIEALNSDLPWSRFVERQIAGDVVGEDVVATGFLAAGPWDYVGHVELREGTADKEITRSLDRDELLRATMSAFCSTTAHCARCHDHRYDPILQRDYYALQAVFAGVDRADREWLSPAERAQRDAILAARAELDAELGTIEAAWQAAALRLPEEPGDAAARELLAAMPRESDEADAGPARLGYHSAIVASADQEMWVEVDLGTPVELGAVVVVPSHEAYGGHPGPGFGFPQRYRIEARAADGVHELVARTTDDVPNPGDEPVYVAVGGVRARFVRFVATRLWERTADHCFALAELAVIDSAGNNVALGRAVSASDSIEAPPRWSRAGLTDGRTSRSAFDVVALVARARMSAAVAAATERRLRAIDAALDPALLARRGALQEERARVEQQLAGFGARRVYAVGSRFAAEGNFHQAEGPRPIHVLHRGDVAQPRELSSPGALSVLDGLAHHFDGLPSDDEGARRVALARWIVDPDNPLTWRSAVNRVWQFHFGRGLVDTANDFGRLGAMPSHPELLDWLACWFRDHGGSLKGLHRLILTSATWQQQSGDREVASRIDGGNRFVWRQARRRLEAEEVRDAMLAVAGVLDPTMGGPSVRQFGFEDDHSPRYRYAEFDVRAPGAFRRSVYRTVVRSVADPFFEALDCPDPSASVARRFETLTPLQALVTWNDRFVLARCEELAGRAAAVAPDLDAQVGLVCRWALCREPAADERAALVAHARAHGLAHTCRVIFNLDEFVFVD